MDIAMVSRRDVSKIEEYLTQCGTRFDRLDVDMTNEIVKKWDRVFARNVKKKTGQWVHNRFRWHGFSYEFETSIWGAEALDMYLAQWQADYVLFDEDLRCCYRCDAQRYPDLTTLGLDIYVAHHNMKWTMVFTHEQPEIGPFFARKVTQ